MVLNRNERSIFIVLMVSLLFLQPGCGERDVNELKSELKREKEKREEVSKKYKDVLRQLAEEKKRSKHLENMLLALGERLEREGRSLPKELALLRKELGGKNKSEEEAAPERTVEKLVELGDNLYSQGNYIAAAEVYTSATEIETENVELYLRLGRAFIKSSRYNEAIPVYEKVVKILGRHGPKEQLRQAYNNLGWLYTQNNRYKEAELAYLRAVKVDSEYANAYYNLGLLYDLYLNDELAAIEAFERYIELGGEHSDWVRRRLKEIRER